MKIISSVYLPPHSETRLYSLKSQKNLATHAVLIEPVESNETKSPLLVARVIATLHNNTVPMHIINTSTQPRKLSKNTTLGYVEHFEDLHQIQNKNYELLNATLVDFFTKFNWPTCLSPNQLQDLKALILNFHDVFSKHDYDLGCLGNEPYRIQLTGEMPKPSRPYRIPQA